MFFRQKKSGDRVYLQIVENRWERGGSKQRVIATLGRLDRLRETGQLDALLESGADVVVLRHPKTISVVRDTIDQLMTQ